VGDGLTAGEIFNITYILTDAEEVVTVDFYYDTDNSGQDGTAISGACTGAAESAVSTTCAWNTNGVPSGSYYVYGVSDDGTNPAVVVYSSGMIGIGQELLSNIEFEDTAGQWTISLDLTESGTGTCVYDTAVTHTADGTDSIKASEAGIDFALTCTVTQDISSLITKDATINTASVWTLFSSNYEAAGDSVKIDLTLPATVPDDTDTNIALDSDVTINFSENMDCASVTNTNITMTPAPVTSWSVFSCSGGQAVMRPVGQVNNTLYTVDVTVNVTDVAGNPATAYSFSYTTEP
jgi:hypothetical protein